MEVLFFIIFGAILVVFIAYGFKLFREDKKILDEAKEIKPVDELDFVAIEYPFYDYYKGFY
jgi:hypothetical protein